MSDETNNEFESIRARSWTTIGYPESLDDNWKSVIDDYHIQWILSPLHDCDVDSNKQPIKPHYHIVFYFEGKKTYKQVLSICRSFGAVNPQKVESMIGMVRYLIHADNPEKYQYSRSLIEVHGGIDIDRFFKRSAYEKNVILAEMEEYIYDNNITNFADFAYYSAKNEPEWFDVLNNSNTMSISHMINGVYQKDNKAKIKWKRMELVWDLYYQGMSVTEISRRLDIARITIYRYLKKIPDSYKEKFVEINAKESGILERYREQRKIEKEKRRKEEKDKILKRSLEK